MAELIHGRASTYNNYKCKCDECRKAWADYIREGGYVRRYQEKQRQKKLEAKIRDLPKVPESATIYYSNEEFLSSLETEESN